MGEIEEPQGLICLVNPVAIDARSSIKDITPYLHSILFWRNRSRKEESPLN